MRRAHYLPNRGCRCVLVGGRVFLAGVDALAAAYVPPDGRSRQPVLAADQRPRKQNIAKRLELSTDDMATQQEEGGVPLSIAHDMQQFRLFELPPDLVELIDAPHPPR